MAISSKQIPCAWAAVFKNGELTLYNSADESTHPTTTASCPKKAPGKSAAPSFAPIRQSASPPSFTRPREISTSFLRQKALEEWRGYRAQAPRPLVNMSEAVQEVLNEFKLKELFDAEQIKRIWDEAVGPVLAKHSEPTSLIKGELVVKVSDPTIRFELERQLGTMLLAKLQAWPNFPKLVSLRYVKS